MGRSKFTEKPSGKFVVNICSDTQLAEVHLYDYTLCVHAKANIHMQNANIYMGKDNT